MRPARVLVALSLFCSSIAMKAVTSRSLDPNYANITITPSSFNFGACPTGDDAYLDASNGNAPIVAAGCFGYANYTGSTITSLTITFPDTPLIQQVDNYPDGAFSDDFTSATETLIDGVYTFNFSGGAGIPETGTFVLDEDGVPYEDMPTVTVNYTNAATAVTPEPASLGLFATGMMGLCGGYLRRRRA